MAEYLLGRPIKVAFSALRTTAAKRSRFRRTQIRFRLFEQAALKCSLHRAIRAYFINLGTKPFLRAVMNRRFSMLRRRQHGEGYGGNRAEMYRSKHVAAIPRSPMKHGVAGRRPHPRSKPDRSRARSRDIFSGALY